VRVAAIDIGSNSVRLLVGDVEKNGVIRVIRTELATTRLGEGMTTRASGWHVSGPRQRLQQPAEGMPGIEKRYLSPRAVKKTMAVLDNYMQIAETCNVEKTVIAATSAVREAANRREFARQVKIKTGVELKILSGEQEALYSYMGVLSGFRTYGEPEARVENIIVVDVGGGSTEIIWRAGERTTGCLSGNICCFSVRAGAVRMTGGENSDEEIREILCPVLSKLPAGKGPVVGVGGTATTMAAVAQGLLEYDPVKINGYILSQQEINCMLQKIDAKSISERKKIPGLPPDRADIIPAGIRIFKAVLEGMGQNFMCVSDAGLLHGLLAAIAILPG